MRWLLPIDLSDDVFLLQCSLRLHPEKCIALNRYLCFCVDVHVSDWNSSPHMMNVSGAEFILCELEPWGLALSYFLLQAKLKGKFYFFTCCFLMLSMSTSYGLWTVISQTKSICYNAVCVCVSCNYEDRVLIYLLICSCCRAQKCRR